MGVCGKSWDVVIKDAGSVSKTSNVVMSELTSQECLIFLPLCD